MKAHNDFIRLSQAFNPASKPTSTVLDYDVTMHNRLLKLESHRVTVNYDENYGENYGEKPRENRIRNSSIDA